MTATDGNDATAGQAGSHSTAGSGANVTFASPQHASYTQQHHTSTPVAVDDDDSHEPSQQQEPSMATTSEPDPEKKRVPRSIYFDPDLLDRMRSAAVYLGAYVPEAGISSLSDIIEPLVEKRLKQLEKKYNEGRPFPAVGRMPGGRPRKQ